MSCSGQGLVGALMHPESHSQTKSRTDERRQRRITFLIGIGQTWRRGGRGRALPVTGW